MKYLVYVALLLLAVPVLAAYEGAAAGDQSMAAPAAPAAAVTAPTTEAAPGAPAAMQPMEPSAMAFQENWLRTYYGISASDLAAWRARGYSDMDIAMAANVAAHTGATTAQILALRDQGRSWEDIARQYNMTTAQVMVLAPRPLMEEELAFHRTMLMRTYGLSSAEIDSLLRMGYSVDEIDMAASIAARSNQPVGDVLALRRQGMSWTQIAQRYNLQPGLVSQPFAMVPMEEDAFFREYLRSRFNVPTVTYTRQRAAGWLPGEILFAAHVAARSRQSVDQVLALREQGLSWREIASRLGVSVAELTTPMPMERVAGVVERERAMPAPVINEYRRYEHKTWGSQAWMQEQRAREQEGMPRPTEQVGSESGRSTKVY